MLQPLFMYIPFATYMSLYMVFVPYGSANKKGLYIYWLAVSTPVLKKKVSWDDFPNIWKVIKFMFQTTNQFIDYTYYLGCTSKDGTMKMLGFLHQSASWVE